MESSHLHNPGKKLLIALSWLLIWELMSRLAGLPFLLPGPLTTFQKMTEMWRKGFFWSSIAGSLLRVLLGFTLSLVIGTFLAIVCGRFSIADEFFSPIKSIFRSTPISSFIILVLLWLSVDATPVLIVFIAVMPIVWQDVYQGIRQTSAELLEMGRIYRFSKKDLIIHIYIPSIAPYFYSACASGIGFAWKSCIAAEVIARPVQSIGKNLQDAKVYLLTEELFAWTVTVVLISIGLEALMKRLISTRRIEAVRGKL